jgi:hypothetical protein
MPSKVWWNAEELADIHLPYVEWSERHQDEHGQPTRSLTAWRLKRAEQRASGGPKEKIKPITHMPATDARLEELLEESEERFLQRYLAFHDEVMASLPQLPQVEVSLPTDEPIGVCLMSDWHIGAEGTDLRRLMRDIDYICRHPSLYVGLGGDVCDNFILEKMGSAAQSSDLQVRFQWRIFKQLMTPLLASNSLLWVSSGNHDQWSIKAAQIDPILASLGDIPVSYIGEGGYVDLTVGEQTYTIYRKHKPARFNSNFNWTHWHKQMLGRFMPREADIVACEHLHRCAIENFPYRGKMHIAACLGSYKVTDLWAMSGGYYDGGYGVPTVVLYPDRRRMLPFMSIEDAVELLDGPSRIPPAAAALAVAS